MEIEKELERIISSGADFNYGGSFNGLVGFGEIYKPNIFLYCFAFFDKSQDFHEVRFDKMVLENSRCIAFLVGDQVRYLVEVDPQERDCADVEEWKKVRSQFYPDWLAEKEMRLNW